MIFHLHVMRGVTPSIPPAPTWRAQTDLRTFISYFLYTIFLHISLPLSNELPHIELSLTNCSNIGIVKCPSKHTFLRVRLS